MSVVNTTVQQLTDLEPIKTWSLIVTLLGDMEQSQLSGKQMGLLLGHIGLKPEAIRVAMHRLKKDGWITTSKNGREVIYRLSKSGVDATNSVYNDVYRTDVKHRNGWKLLLVESDDSLDGSDGEVIRLLKRLYVLPKGHATDCGSVLEIDVQDNKIPTWLVERLIPADVLRIAEQVNALALAILNSETVNLAHSGPNSIDDAALRLLFLHRWRKMALHENTWAHVSLFPNGVMSQCHQHVTQLLAGWPRLDANWQA